VNVKCKACSALPSLLISAAAAAWCWWATGPELGLFLGAPLLATLYLPPLVLAEEGRGRWLAVLSSASGATLVWAIAAMSADVTAWEWLRCGVVLAAYVWALGGTASLLALARFPPPLASGVPTILGLLWLTWPVWLSHWLTQGLVTWLVPAHPLMAINSVLKHLGTWDRAPLAYRALTVLNQDVPYRLPRGILWAVSLHLLIGAPGMALVLRRRRGTTEITPSEAVRPP